MSHYAVAVFHEADQSIDELLAPYDENLEVEPYVRFTREEAIQYARDNYKSYKDATDDKCWECMAEGRDTDDDGNILTTYNPDSKWDWYQEGGRYSGLLKVDGEEMDEARVGDIDFSMDMDVYNRSLRFWDVVVEHQQQEPGEDFWSIFKEDYYLETYHDRETYARYMAQWSVRAVVTPDGEWHEVGQMGWWGMSSESPDETRDWQENFKSRFIDTADPDWILTIVDCHI